MVESHLRSKICYFQVKIWFKNYKNLVSISVFYSKLIADYKKSDQLDLFTIFEEYLCYCLF